MPDGLNMAIWFNLSPLRPDEWAATDVERWMRNVQLRNAYQAGVDDAEDEARAAQELSEG